MSKENKTKKKATSQQRRQHPRVKIKIEVPYWKYVKFKHKEEVYIGFVKNLSLGGFFIETDMIYGKDDEVGFEFYLPNASKPLCGKAKVMWYRTPDQVADPSMVSGMGLQFVEFEKDCEFILEKFIRQELKERS